MSDPTNVKSLQQEVWQQSVKDAWLSKIIDPRSALTMSKEKPQPTTTLLAIRVNSTKTGQIQLPISPPEDRKPKLYPIFIPKTISLAVSGKWHVLV